MKNILNKWFFVLFLQVVVSAFCLGQVKVDSTGFNLKTVNINIKHDNYSGFDVNGQIKVEEAFSHLASRFSSTAQNQLVVYDQILFRHDVYAGNVRDNIKKHVQYAKNASTYFIIVSAVWQDAQSVNDFGIYFNLPESEIPAFSYFDSTFIATTAIEFMYEAFAERGYSQSRIRESQAAALTKWEEFLFKEFIIKPIVDTVFFGENKDKNEFDYKSVTFSGKCMTPSQEIIYIPGENGETVLRQYTNCNYELKNKDVTVPMGALLAFKKDGHVYYACYIETPKLVFYGYCRRNENGGHTIKYIQPDIPSPSSVNYVETWLSLTEGVWQHYNAKIENYPYYNNQDTKGFLLSEIYFQELTPVGASETGPPCGKLPAYSTNIDISTLMNRPVIEEFKYKGVLSADINQDHGAPVVYDLTGRFRTDEWDDAAMSIVFAKYLNAGPDMVITEEPLSAAAIYKIRFAIPMRRDLIWIHLNNARNKFRYELIPRVSTSENSEAIERAEKQNKLVQEMMKHMADNGSMLNAYKVTSIFSSLMHLSFENIRIPPKYYDCSLEEYVLREVGFSEEEESEVNHCNVELHVPTLIQISGPNVDEKVLIADLRAKVAIASGMINAYEDALAGYADLATMIMMKQYFDNASTPEKLIILLGLLDELNKLAKTLSQTENIYEFIIGKPLEEVTPTEKYYYKGYILSTIGIMIAEELATGGFSSASRIKSLATALEVVSDNSRLISPVRAFWEVENARIIKNAAGDFEFYFGDTKMYTLAKSDKVLYHVGTNGVNVNDCQHIFIYKIGTDAENNAVYFFKVLDNGVVKYYTSAENVVLNKISITYNVIYTPTNMQNIITMLGRSIDNNLAKLLDPQIVDIINAPGNKWSKTEIEALFDDLINSANLPDGIGAKLDDLTPNQLESWRSLRQANVDVKIRRDYHSLTTVETYMSERIKTPLVVKSELIAAGGYRAWLIEHLVTYEKNGYKISRDNLKFARETHLEVVDGSVSANPNGTGGINGGHVEAVFREHIQTTPASSSNLPSEATIVVDGKEKKIKGRVVLCTDYPIGTASANSPYVNPIPIAGKDGWKIYEYRQISTHNATVLLKEPNLQGQLDWKLGGQNLNPGPNLLPYEGHVLRKTVYDPSIVSPIDVDRLGYELFLNAIDEPSKYLRGTKVTIPLNNTIAVEGYFTDQKVPNTWYYRKNNN